MASATDSTGAAPASGTGRTIARSAAEDARAFRAARRHTWLVRALKLAAPLTALAVVAGYGVLLRANFAFSIGNFGVDKVTVTEDDLKMKNPSYFGTTNEGGKYTVRAREAVVGLKQTEPIKLTGIDGDLTQPDGTTAVLRAKRGLFDNNRGELELLDEVAIDTSNGMRARMLQAKVFTKQNRIISNGSVAAETATGTITARAMDLYTRARRGTFTGDVNLRLIPGAGAEAGRAGFATGRDQNQPVDIKSQSLVVDDAAKTAVFSPAVRAVQGDTTLQATELRVTYEGKVDPSALGQVPKPAGEAVAAEPSKLSKIAARGGVFITALPDRNITAEQADFDVQADTALLLGTVVVQQGRNVLRGTRLALDRKSGRSRLDSPAGPGQAAGRIAATFVQAAPKPAPGKAAAKPVVALAAASPLGNFKTDPNAPMNIDAETLDLNDNAHQAIFRGLVRAQQGEFIVQAAEVVANYTGSAGLAATPEGGPAKTGAKTAGPELTRIEAHLNVIITSKDGQSAKGDLAVFDTKTNIVTLSGKPVVVAQGQNVVECSKLVIDLNTGLSNCISDGGPKLSSIEQMAGPAETGVPSIVRRPVPSTDGRMKAIFYPKDINEAAKKRQAAPAAPGPGPTGAPARPVVDGWDSSTNPAPARRATP